MRKDSLFDDVMKLPWPVGVGLAAFVFFVFHTYQLVAPQTQLSLAFFPAIKMLAYFFIVMFLFNDSRPPGRCQTCVASPGAKR
jgi:hypothetical protein